MIRWLNLARSIWKANRGTLGHPFKLTYVVTRECRSRCVNCKIWNSKPQNELTLEEVDKFARANPHFHWINFTGGEPTDRPDLVEIIEIFLAHNPNLIFVHFPTNGLLPDRIEAITRKVARLRPPRFVVSVSIDGPETINDQLRGIKGDFALAIDTYRRLKAVRGVQTSVGMTLYERNQNLIQETFTDIRKRVPGFRFKDLHVNVAHISGHFYGNEKNGIRPSPDLLPILDDFRARRGVPISPFEWVEWWYQKQAKTYLSTGLTPQDCGALWTTCFLDATGTLYPCSIWGEPLGNIRETGYSIQSMLKSEKAAVLRKCLLAKDCPNCWSPCEAYPTMAANLFFKKANHP